MTDEDGAVLRRLGWCDGPDGTQKLHGLCRYQYTNSLGVLTRCNCTCGHPTQRAALANKERA